MPRIPDPPDPPGPASWWELPLLILQVVLAVALTGALFALFFHYLR